MPDIEEWPDREKLGYEKEVLRLLSRQPSARRIREQIGHVSNPHDGLSLTDVKDRGEVVSWEG